MQALNNYLIRFDWTTITSSTDVDECYSLFINEIIDAINFHCPLKKVHFRTSINQSINQSSLFPDQHVQK